VVAVSELALVVPDQWLEAVAERVLKLLAERAQPAPKEFFHRRRSGRLRALLAATHLRPALKRAAGRHSDGRRALVSRAELDVLLLPAGP
jgi:hypothetical protein